MELEEILAYANSNRNNINVSAIQFNAILKEMIKTYRSEVYHLGYEQAISDHNLNIQE